VETNNPGKKRLHPENDTQVVQEARSGASHTLSATAPAPRIESSRRFTQARRERCSTASSRALSSAAQRSVS